MTELFMEIIGKEKHTKAGRQGCIIIVPLGHTFCLGDIAIKDRVSPIFLYTLTLFRHTDIIEMVINMNINDILKETGITKYRLSKLSGVPHATLNDLCSGKSRIEKCSAETLYKIAKALDVSMKVLIEDEFNKFQL